MYRPSLILGTLTAFLCACGGGDSASDDVVTVRDSAGVTIVENAPLTDAEELLAAAEPVLQIGMMDGPEAYQLFRVTDAKRLPDGGFAVANGGSRELKIYESDGAHRVTAGGSGRGPGEFGYPVAVQILEDTILVQDRYDRAFFSADGRFLRRETTDVASLEQRLRGNFEGMRWLAVGTALAPIHGSAPVQVGPPYRPPMIFVRISEDLERVDTLGSFGGILQQYVDVGEMRPSSVVPPFASSTGWGVGAADGTIVIADSAVPQIEIFHPDGRRTIARWSAPPGAVRGAEVEAWKDTQRDASWTQGRLPQLERAWAAMDVPQFKPYYGAAATGADGRTWLGPVEGEANRWTVIGADGHVVGVASLPARFTPMDSGPGWVMGLFRDEVDVQYIRLYELVAP